MIPMIELTGIVKTYVRPAGPVEALRGVSLWAGAGEIFGIIGWSGAGWAKPMTTLLEDNPSPFLHELWRYPCFLPGPGTV